MTSPYGDQNAPGTYAPQISEQDDVLAEPKPQFSDSGVLDGSALDRLQGALAEETRTENYHHRIPKRKILRIILDPNIDGDKFQRWQRNAMDKRVRGDGTGNNIDAMRLAATVIGNQMIGLEVATRDGGWEEAYDEQGDPLNFRSPKLKQMLAPEGNTISAAELVKKLFGNDGHMLDCSRILVEKAGYGDQDQGDDDDPLV